MTAAKRKPAPWGQKHRREAEARVYELAATEARKGSSERAQITVETLAVDPDLDEAGFREILFTPAGPALRRAPAHRRGHHASRPGAEVSGA